MNDDASLSLLTQPVGSLVRRASVVASPSDSIHQVAQMMRQEKVSSVMLLEGDRIAGTLEQHHHHHHFQCTRCQQVFDIHACLGNLASMAPPGFKVESHEVVLYGRCKACG